jgi:thioredoxin-related protein
MKKENVLVGVLIVIAVAGIFLFNNSKNTESATQASETPLLKPLSGTLPITESDTIGWKGYTPGMAMAGKENKSVFLYFHAEWCTYCKKLKQTTFQDQQIKAYLEDNFISIQVDTDKEEALAREWKVKGLPTLWFLEFDGTRISSIPGYLDATQLLQILKYVHTKSYNTMDFQEFIKQG